MKQSLREHLDACAPCREYLSASKRVIASLGGFSFEVNPVLHAKVLASPARPAQLSRRLPALISVAAVLFTIGGSLIDLQFGGVIADVFGIQLSQARHALLAFWVVPSLCVLLLLPLMPLLLKAGTHREERIL